MCRIRKYYKKMYYHCFVIYFSINLEMNSLQNIESRFRFLSNYAVQQIFHKITEDAPANWDVKTVTINEV